MQLTLSDRVVGWLQTFKSSLLTRAGARTRARNVAELSVLFICTGNICRSPTAQGVFEFKLAEAGLSERVFVDSAGTHGFHRGSPPDSRAQAAASRRGIDLSNQRSRRIGADDFTDFDLIVCMDRDNLTALQAICPQDQRRKLSLFMQYLPQGGLSEVPDPYYGAAQGFEQALDLINSASDALLAHLRKSL